MVELAILMLSIVCWIAGIVLMGALFFWVLWHTFDRERILKRIVTPMRFRIKAFNKTSDNANGYYVIEVKLRFGWWCVEEFLFRTGVWNVRLEKYDEALRLAKLWKENPEAFWADVEKQKQAVVVYRSHLEARQQVLFPVDEQEV